MEQSQPHKSTYVFDPESGAELARLIEQDRFSTREMGGPLVGLPDLPAEARVLDLACGPGGWVLDVAYEHPEYEVCGVDISEATKQAVTGAIEAADEIGTEASKTVRDVLSSSIKGAKDVIKTPFK